jgi:hypothetical protein
MTRPHYLYFSPDTDPDRAREIYHHRFGTDPKIVQVAHGWLIAGPCPERVTQPEESAK